MPRMNDRPAASIAFWFASEIIPASATTVTSGSRWAAMKVQSGHVAENQLCRAQPGVRGAGLRQPLPP
jgi:hypothetical protein